MRTIKQVTRNSTLASICCEEQCTPEARTKINTAVFLMHIVIEWNHMGVKISSLTVEMFRIRRRLLRVFQTGASISMLAFNERA